MHLLGVWRRPVAQEGGETKFIVCKTVILFARSSYLSHSLSLSTCLYISLSPCLSLCLCLSSDSKGTQSAVRRQAAGVLAWKESIIRTYRYCHCTTSRELFHIRLYNCVHACCLALLASRSDFHSFTSDLDLGLHFACGKVCSCCGVCTL